ncbi:MAG TPA: hypothetical protein VFO67_03975 [Gemmatimonadales bacterium]|nr:hypothetical protein [Gemmatimonadales bacterium]
MRSPLRRLRNCATWLLTLGTLASCEHTAPFSPVTGGSNGPLVPASITQLTYSPGQDLIPAWLPDGSAFVYTAERRDRVDHDRCLAVMDRGGGSISRYACRTVAADDSINVFDEATILGDSIAYVRTSTERFLQGIGPDRQELVIAPLADPNAARVVQQIPFTTPWGATYDMISHIAWLGPGKLAFIGERVSYPRACRSCVPDTVRFGLEIAIADVTTIPTTVARMVDGDSASSLAPSANGDTVYFTKNADTHVFRHTMSDAQTDTLFAFIDVARDISVSAGQLAAIVGGVPGGPTTPDRGGALFHVSFPGGGPLVGEIGLSGVLYRRPALSPDGVRLVVSGWSGAPNADLWLFTSR